MTQQSTNRLGKIMLGGLYTVAVLLGGAGTAYSAFVVGALLVVFRSAALAGSFVLPLALNLAYLTWVGGPLVVRHWHGRLGRRQHWLPVALSVPIWGAALWFYMNALRGW